MWWWDVGGCVGSVLMCVISEVMRSMMLIWLRVIADFVSIGV